MNVHFEVGCRIGLPYGNVVLFVELSSNFTIKGYSAVQS